MSGTQSGAIGQFAIGVSPIGGASVGTITGSAVPATIQSSGILPGQLTQFTPNAYQLFTFQATLDGALYTVNTTWNLYRQDWYINVYSQSNLLIVSRPLVGSPSPPEPGINLAAPWFSTSSLYYYPFQNVFSVVS